MYKYQLLYVYISACQTGGEQWYAVFDYSMLALLCGIFTLICYLAIRQTFESGPFYALLPLPVLVYYFWKHCNNVFKRPASVRDDRFYLLSFVIPYDRPFLWKERRKWMNSYINLASM